MAKTTHGSQTATSDESSVTELTVGKLEGKAYGAALSYLTTMEASDSGHADVQDYVVAYSFEEAEGLYHMEDGALVWHEPEEENCHIEIAVRSASDGRFVPSLSVTATLRYPDGTEVCNFDLPFLWHPWVYHYNRNCVVPEDGRYYLKVEIAPPTFPRHDRVNGKRFAEPVSVDFEVNIKTGCKQGKAA